MSESRTSKSITNAKVSIFFYLAQMLVGFWSRKVFYEYLGSEVLGLDTTATTMLGFLNLAELGIGSAVSFFLYKPMYESNFRNINEIVTLQGWIYRRIAFIIIFAGIVLMCFFPVIFKDIQIPLWYAYATFCVLLFGALLSYFFNYRMCVLYADQKEYKTTRVMMTANLGFKILLILLLPVVSYPFLLYIGTNLFATIFGTLWLNYVLKKEYPWLKSVPMRGKELMDKYPDLLKKTKQIFVNRISTVVVLEFQPMIMYAFSSLTSVAYYGNYIAIIGKAKDIIKTSFSSTQAGVGNLVASNDIVRIKKVFWELFDSRLCFATAAILVLGFITNPFITVWLSPDYLLGTAVLLLVLFQSWIAILRTTVDNFITGYGLFHDIWAPITESILYLGGSCLFGHFWGIAGVLMGGLLSNLIIICTWKPIFLFRSGFKESPLKNYFIPFFKRLLLIFVNILMLYYLNELSSQLYDLDSFIKIGIYGLCLCLIIFPLFYLEFLIFSPGMRDFNHRMVNILKNKL